MNELREFIAAPLRWKVGALVFCFGFWALVYLICGVF